MCNLAIASVFAFAQLKMVARENKLSNTNQPPKHTYTCVMGRFFLISFRKTIKTTKWKQQDLKIKTALKYLSGIK